MTAIPGTGLVHTIRYLRFFKPYINIKPKCIAIPEWLLDGAL
jgi:hypothetical protein